MFIVKKDQPDLDFSVVQGCLEELLEASANFLERQWPNKYQIVDSARVIFYTRMRLVINTYSSIMWLTADIPADPRRKYLVLATPPLIRSLFEELMYLIFVFHDLPALMQSFAMTNYTELALEINHAERFHHTKPEWSQYISDSKKRLEGLGVKLKLSPKQAENPKSEIGRWPTPGRMIRIVKERWPDSTNIEFMEYIQSWLYRTLSGDTHLSFHGVVRRGSFYATKETRESLGIEDAKIKEAERYESFKMEMIWTMVSLLLSIVSEIEIHFQFGLAARAKYLWVIFEQHSDLAKEFYKSRYQQNLASL